MSGGVFAKSKSQKHPSSGGRFAKPSDPVGGELGDGLSDALERSTSGKATRAAAAESKRSQDVKSAEAQMVGGDTE